MATSDYLILQAQVEYPSASTPRIFYKLGAAPVGTIGMAICKPNGTTGTFVAMTQLGVGVLSQTIYYADVADAYALGQWNFVCADDNDTAGTAQYGSFQWGGLADMIVAINTTTQPGGTIFNNTAAARKALVNRWEVTDTTNPAAPVITVYEDDDVTPIGSRSVRNGDASNVSLAQVLNVGKVT